MNRRHTTTGISAFLLALALIFAGCSSNGDDGASPAPTDAATEDTAAPTDAGADGPLTVVVTNDDGIDAPGIDALVTAISALDDVEVHVVAPLENQSTTGDRTTDGEVTFADGETASGVAGTAVDGFPADTIAVAIDELGLEPDLVASGINEGQNVGPLTEISGTVGAAMTAARRGIPAVAGSAGFGEDASYEAAAELVAEWITEKRGDILDGSYTVEGVVNVNVPECTVGSVRGVQLVETGDEIADEVDPFTADCEAELDFTTPDDDVQAIANGFVAISEVPLTEPGDDADSGDSPDGNAPDDGADAPDAE